MSHWEKLYAGHAFKPHPSLWELGEAHVPFAELGVANPPEHQIATHLNEGDGVILLTGAPGQGKSSTFAHVARNVDRHPESERTYLPLFIPVAARADSSIDVERFGREVIFEFISALAGALPARERERLERSLASQVSHQRTPAAFNAKLRAGLPGLGGDIGVALARDTVTIVGKPELDAYGGLRTLGTIARTHGGEPVVIVEDTDAWAARSDGAAVAEAFFTRVLRPLVSDADVTVLVAVQDRWTGEAFYREIADRAIAELAMPVIATQSQARKAVELVCRRRIERVLPAGTLSDPVRDLFTDAALEMLAATMTAAGSFRDPLQQIRDTLDRFSDALPARIDVEHLIEASA